jgi:DNA-binding transcriptional LysR family regulator
LSQATPAPARVARSSRQVIIPDLRGFLAAVIPGAGISAIPRYLAEPAILSGAVVALHSPELPPINLPYRSLRAGSSVTPATAVVI